MSVSLSRPLFRQFLFVVRLTLQATKYTLKTLRTTTTRHVAKQNLTTGSIYVHQLQATNGMVHAYQTKTLPRLLEVSRLDVFSYTYTCTSCCICLELVAAQTRPSSLSPDKHLTRLLSRYLQIDCCYQELEECHLDTSSSISSSLLSSSELITEKVQQPASGSLKFTKTLPYKNTL